MRVTQKAINRNYLKGVNRNLLDYTNSTHKMNTGRKFSKVSDDVSSAARAFKVRTALSRNEQYIENIDNIAATVNVAEDLSRNINDWVKTLEERLVQATGPAVSEDEKKIIGQEVMNLKENIIQAINGSSTGTYIFGGSENQAPFKFVDVPDPNDPTKTIKELQFRDGTPVDSATSKSDFDDKDVFMDIGFGLAFDKDGNLDTTSVVKSSTSGIDLLGFGMADNGLPNNLISFFDKVANDLMNGASNDELLKDLGHTQDRHAQYLIQITDIGNRSTFLNENKERIENEITGLKERQTDLEAVKVEEELIYNNTYYSAYQISLQLGSKIMPMSIFNFMR